MKEALKKATKGTTSIVIAHRLSTVMEADKIVVVRAGEIVEQGPPQLLLDRDEGAFRSLFDSQ